MLIATFLHLLQPIVKITPLVPHKPGAELRKRRSYAPSPPLLQKPHRDTQVLSSLFRAQHIIHLAVLSFLFEWLDAEHAVARLQGLGELV